MTALRAYIYLARSKRVLRWISISCCPCQEHAIVRNSILYHPFPTTYATSITWILLYCCLRSRIFLCLDSFVGLSLSSTVHRHGTIVSFASASGPPATANHQPPWPLAILQVLQLVIKKNNCNTVLSKTSFWSFLDSFCCKLTMHSPLLQSINSCWYFI